MEHLRTVVVGVDFTPPSKTALLQAVRLAGFSRASVRAAYVVDTIVTIELEAAMAPMSMQVHDTLVQESREAWAAFSKQVPGAEAVEFHCEVNNRAFGFLHYARDAHADLIAIGAYADKPDTGFGTMAAACARHGPCDTLIVREDHPGPFKAVAVGVDFSPTSLRALERAVRLATQDSAELRIVHVSKAPWTELPARPGAKPLVSPEQQRAYTDNLRLRLRAFAAPLERELAYLKPIYDVHEATGHRGGLAGYAERHGIDLLVLGTRGRTTLRDIVLGSTAEKTLRQATCSVLAVTPG